MSFEYYVRELSKKDITILNRWKADRELISFLGSPFRYIDQEVDEKWFDAYQRSRNNNVRLSVCEKDTDLLVAAVYLLSVDWISRNCELAIMVGDVSNRGKGLGSFALRSALEHAFNDLGLHKVHLTVLESNTAAQSLYIKNGFKKEGLLRDAVFKNNQYHNMIQMGLLKSEFKEKLS